MRNQMKIYVCLTFCATSLLLYSFLTIGNPLGSQIPDVSTIIDDGNITDHVWSSDGTKIAYVKCLDGQPWNGELWVAEWNGKKIGNKQLIFTGVEMLHDWQDEWILFCIKDGENPDPSAPGVWRELWKMKDDGTSLTQVTFTYSNGIKYAYNPTYNYIGTTGWGRFIPGTDLVYFSAHNGNGWYHAYTCKADGSDHWKRVSGSYNSFTIDMSPTGNKILFGDDWQGGWNSPTDLYASDVDGSNRVKIKRFPHRVPPLVLADGDTIVYRFVPRPSVPASLEGNIYAINMDGSKEWTVIDDEYLNYPENYHPFDGQSLLMRSNRAADGNTHMFKINVDGTGIVQLTEGPYNDEGAIYSPDGEFIMYRRLPEDYVKSTLPYAFELVIKRVDDVVNPWSSHPDDQTVDRMQPDVNIVWELYDDADPGAFVVLRNGAIVTYPLEWYNASAIMVPVDTSEVGDWNYTIVFSDGFGNPGFPDTVWITVLDVTNPWSTHPDDQTVHLLPPGMPAYLIVWELYDDLAPGTFTVLCNENLVMGPTAWINDTAIVIPVFASEVCELNYTIVFTDAAGNIASDTCIITVKEIFPWP